MAKAKKGAKGKSDFETFVKRPAELTVLTDHPMPADEAKAGFERDPFNLRYKLGPVYDIVRYKTPDGGKDRDGQTPLAILISGGWGTGKTSAMRWLEGLLNDWNKVAKADDVKVHPVWFYPWKYDNKEDVWRGLISEVIIESIKVENVTWQRAKNAAKQFGLFLGKSFLHALASVKFRGKVSAGVAEAEAEADLTCLKDILGEYQEAAHPEKAYLNEFEGSLKDWVTATLAANERIIVFIDDLDRCMPDIALQVLEALKLYLNIPKLIFVVGVDRTVIEKLVVEHYTKLGLVRRRTEKDTDSDHEQRRADEAKARQYLAKMFQVEVELAPSQHQVEAFFADQLAGIPYWKNNLKEEAHRDLFRDVVLELARRNPREVKRLLNSALMAGAGTEMMLDRAGATSPTFAQGLQDYFVRAILQRYYPSLADMTATDVGRQFFVDWSSLVTERQEKGKDAMDDESSRRPSRETTLTHHAFPFDSSRPVFPFGKETERKDEIVEQLRNKPEYKDYLRLTSDKLLVALMQIPFSGELAQRTRHVPMTVTGKSSTMSRVCGLVTDRVSVSESETVESAPSKDRTIIRETMARSLGKSPTDLTADDDHEVTRIDLSSSQVSDVTPLAALTKLQSLNLEGTQVSDVTPLAALTNLQSLYLGETPVSDITALSALTNLQTLDLQATQVSDGTPLKGLTNLQELDLAGTQVSDVTPLKDLTNLQRLDLRDTQVSDVKPLKGLTNLQGLFLWNTQVSDVTPLAALTNLQTLYLMSTQVRDVTPLAALTNLQSLYLARTPVSDVTPLAALTNLRALELRGMQVSDLTPLSGLTNLQSLYLGETPVSDITALSALTNLQTLDLQATQVSDGTPLKGLTNLQGLSLRNTQVSDVTPLKGLTNLQTLYLMSTQVRDVTPLKDLTNLQRLDLRNTQVSDVTPLTALTNLQRLDLTVTQVSDVKPLAALTNLQTLYLMSTQVRDVTPLKDLTNLQWLGLEGTQVNDVTPLTALTNLQTLDLQATQVSDVTPLAALTNLQSLDLQATQVSDVTPLAALTNLQSLNLAGTQVRDVTPLKDLTNLQRLDLRNTQVSDVTPLAALTNLQTLYLMSTQVRDVTPLKDLTNLQWLGLEGTQVNDVTPLTALTNLQTLDLQATQVSDVTPLAALTNLQSLDLQATQVSDVTPLAALTNLQSLNLAGTQVSDVTPLAALTNLQELFLWNTQVSDVTPLKDLTNLQWLGLAGTQVSDVKPLKDLTNLQRLGLEGTPVSEEQVKRLREALPKARITG